MMLFTRVARASVLEAMVMATATAVAAAAVVVAPQLLCGQAVERVSLIVATLAAATTTTAALASGMIDGRRFVRLAAR